MCIYICIYIYIYLHIFTCCSDCSLTFLRTSRCCLRTAQGHIFHVCFKPLASPSSGVNSGAPHSRPWGKQGEPRRQSTEKLSANDVTKKRNEQWELFWCSITNILWFDMNCKSKTPLVVSQQCAEVISTAPINILLTFPGFDQVIYNFQNEGFLVSGLF